VSTPQLVRPREIVRGIHVEEEEVGVRQRPHLIQWEDTDADSVVEADGAEIVFGQARGDCFPTGRPVCGAEGLDPAPPAALRQDGVRAFQTLRQCPDQRFGNKRHIPRDTYHRCRRFDHCRVDAAQGAEAGTNVGHRAEVGSPPGGIRRIGHQERWLSQRGLESPCEAIEYSFASDQLQTLRLAAEPGRPPAGEDGPANPNSLGCAAAPLPRCPAAPLQYRLPFRRSSTTSNPIVMLKRCLYVNLWGGTRFDSGVVPVTRCTPTMLSRISQRS
jgi:hypothetical protein